MIVLLLRRLPGRLCCAVLSWGIKSETTTDDDDDSMEEMEQADEMDELRRGKM